MLAILHNAQLFGMVFLKKKLFFLIFLVCCVIDVNAQKKTISASDLGTWNVVMQNMRVNNDGSALCYYISDKPAKGQFTAVLRSTKSNWSKEFIRGYPVHFTGDNRKVVLMLPEREFVVQYIDSERKYKIGNVGKNCVWSGRDGDWLIYIKEPKESRELVLVDLTKNEDTTVYHQVDDFFASSGGRNLIIVTKVDSNNYSLKLLDNKTRQIHEFYRGGKPSNIILDKSGRKIAFLTTSGNPGELQKTIWYWEIDSMKAPKVVTPSVVADPGLELSSLEGFNEKYGFVFCTLINKLSVKSKLVTNSLVTPTIWKYNSFRLESDSSNTGNSMYTCSAAWYLNENKLIQLQKYGEGRVRNSDARRQLLFSRSGYKGEWNWNEKSIPSCVLVDMSTGARVNLATPGDRNVASYVLSPEGNRIVYYDAVMRAYFSYDIASGRKENITSRISANWTTYDRDDEPFAKYINIGVAGFSKDESKVFLYDQFDIYEIDLINKSTPINLTEGYGKANNIVFRFAFFPDAWDSERIFLTAFNRRTKESGFFEVRRGKPGSLKMLTMQQALFTGVDESKYAPLDRPVKAKETDVYFLTRMDASHAPDVCLTRDFKTFRKLSDVHPEKDYNWIKTELVNFKTLDGMDSQGILYKPEDFNPSKKYPLIFYYYEKISECLNLFIAPDVCEGPINIPYLVSNGYLVFTPDIHFEIGYPGRSSFRTVMGAADKLVKLPYVDSTKMGIQGHSFGGFQTNYIVTRTNRFAAACSAAGFTNFVSAYGAVIGDGYSRQGQYELYRDRIGASLWARPDLYLENSPVLNIDKINTPMLLMHNKDDNDVPVEQGLEFFTGLRRLGKTAYLLQYKEQGHTLVGEAAMDYTNRVLDFFNFYLRNGKLPNWMDGRPANIVKFNYPFHDDVISHKE